MTTGPVHRLRASLAGGPLSVLVVLFALNAVDELTRAAFGVLAPDIAADFGTSIAGMFTVLAFVAAVALGLQVPIATLADRRNRVRLAVLGGLLMAAFTSAVGLSPNIWVLGVTMGAAGLGKSFIDPTHNSLLSDHFHPDVRARVFSLHRSANALGQFVGPLLAGFIAYRFSWRVPFVVFGPVVALSALAALSLPEPVRGRWERSEAGAAPEAIDLEEPAPSMVESWRMCWKVDSLRRIYRTLPFLAPAVVGFVSFAAFLYADEFGLDERSRGVLASLTEPAQLVGLLIGGAVGTRMYRRDPEAIFRFLGLITLGVSGLAVGFALSPAWFVEIGNIRLPWVAMGLNALISGSLAFLVPGILAALSVAIPPRARSMGFSMMSVFVIPGLALLPLIGALGDAWGMRAGMMAMAPIFAVGGFAIQSAGTLVRRDIHDVWTGSAARAEVLAQRRDGVSKLLLVRDLDVSYGDVQVLFGVDLEVGQGEVVALLGTNGAGKSTLLAAVSGVREADRGAIIFDGVDITHAPANEIAAKGIAVLPGGKGVFPESSVADNLRAASWMNRRDPELVARRTAEVQRVFPVLAQRHDETAANLSGGQQQMLALAMVMLSRPRLLMIDELSLGLAPLVVEQLLEVVGDIAQWGTTVVIVEQSVNLALRLSDRAVFMEKGEVRFDGPTAELLDRPDVLRSVFLGGADAQSVGSGASGRGCAVGDEVGSTEHNRGSDESSGGSAAECSQASVSPVLSLRGVTRRFAGVVAVAAVDLDVAAGEIVGLVGANGAGKTTLFDLIGGFLRPDAGSILLDGADVTALAAHRRAIAGLGRSFQDAALFPQLTVEQVLAVAHEGALGIRNPLLEALWTPGVYESEEAVAGSVNALIERFGLGSLRSRFMHELSTGSRRIVYLAAVVARRPRVVLLDEPSSGIAQREAEALAPLIQRLRDEMGFTVVVIEHDISLLRGLADRLVALDSGSVIASGLPEEVLVDPAVVQAYLGGSGVAIARSGKVSS